MYQIRRIHYEDVELDEGELMTIAEAANFLGQSVFTVASNVSAGRLTEVIDPNRERGTKRSRLVLRSEVEAWKQRKG